ncbi:MAG TPA: FliA/WhiG family RNA polymerase sigma factor [Anaerolineaceae bacterium]
MARADEVELVHQFVTNRSPEIREKIVLQHTSLVHFVLGRMGVSREIGPDYEDMVSQGLMGLIDAVDHYDPNYGTQFSSYAVLRIRGKVLDYMRSADWMTRSSRKRIRVVQKAITDLWEKLHREPTDDEIAAQSSMDISSVQQALVDSSRVLVSMDMEVETEEDGTGSFHELLADERQVDPFEAIGDLDLKERMIQAISELPERERLVLSLYYYDELTFKEIGEVLKVSESRVCQLHARAVLNLKGMLSEEAQHEPRKTRKMAGQGRPL